MASEHARRVHFPLHRANSRTEPEDAHVLERAQDEHQHRLRKALIDLGIVALLIVGAAALGEAP